MYDFLIVGCGFSGATLAERLANVLNKRVLVVDKRNHIAGNAYDCQDENGILVSKYGAHIFHTNSERIWNYISQFASFNGYVHRVDASIRGKLYALPLNLATFNKFFNLNLSAEEISTFLNSIRVPIANPANAEEAVVSKVGWELYEAFYKRYTLKQWGIDPRELDASVTDRLPIRLNDDTRYFTDRWQGMPNGGYTKLFSRMLASKNIHVLLNADYRDVVGNVRFDKMIFSGPIDMYFDYEYGRLPYRSIEFKCKTLDTERYQHMAVVNYPNEHDYTRCVEYKHFYNQAFPKTTVSWDFPCWNDDEPYYPVPSQMSRQLHTRYKMAAAKLKSVYFCGRLGTYQYYNMDQCIGQALHLFETQVAKKQKTMSHQKGALHESFA
jgi:UDP-galactopyranose mutase